MKFKRLLTIVIIVMAMFSVVFFAEAKSSTSPSINLDLVVVKIYKGGSEKLTATTYPKNQTVTWKSSDTKIATVTSSGKVVGKDIGKCTVTASFKYKNKTYTATCPVYVKYPTISFKYYSKTMYYGKTYSLGTKVWGKSLDVSYKSSSTKVATVNNEGTITPKAKGSCIISGTANGVRANCKVTVIYPEYTVKFNVNGTDVKKASNYKSSIAITYGNKTVAPKNCVTRNNYTFVGWCTTKDGKGTIIKNGGDISKLSLDNGATIILYAIWKSNNNDPTNKELKVVGTANDNKGNITIMFDYDGWDRIKSQKARATVTIGDETHTVQGTVCGADDGGQFLFTVNLSEKFTKLSSGDYVTLKFAKGAIETIGGGQKSAATQTSLYYE